MSTPVLLLGPGKPAGDRSTALMAAPRPRLMPWWAPDGMTLAETEAWYAWAVRNRPDLFQPMPIQVDPYQGDPMRWARLRDRLGRYLGAVVDLHSYYPGGKP